MIDLILLFIKENWPWKSLIIWHKCILFIPQQQKVNPLLFLFVCYTYLYLTKRGGQQIIVAKSYSFIIILHRGKQFEYLVTFSIPSWETLFPFELWNRTCNEFPVYVILSYWGKVRNSFMCPLFDRRYVTNLSYWFSKYTFHSFFNKIST